jgi:hypothetical protein
MKRLISQPRSPKEASTVHQQPDASLTATAFTTITSANLLRLQHLVGNQAVQWLVSVSNLQSPSPPPLLQRTAEETGLRQDQLTDAFVANVHDFCANGANAEKSVAAFLRLLRKEVNQALKTIDVPPVEIVQQDTGGFGSFQSKTWQIGFSYQQTVGDAATIEELTQENILESVKTMYHEARHAEQLFRIARMLAGKQLTSQPDGTSPQRQNIIEQLVDKLDIEPGIARQALRDPLVESDSREFKEAEQWLEGLSDIYKHYPDYLRRMRNNTLHTLIRQLIAALIGDKHGNGGLVPDNYDVLPEEQKQQIDEEAADELQEIEEYLNVLYENAHEFEETCNAILDKDAVQRTETDQFMLQHLQQMLSDIAEIQKMSPIEVAEVHQLRALLVNVGEVALQIIKTFPTERDARELDQTIEDKFKQAQSG